MRRKLLTTCALLGGICLQSTCNVSGSSGSSGLFGNYPSALSGGGVMPAVPNVGMPLIQSGPPSGGGRIGGSTGLFGFTFGSP